MSFPIRGVVLVMMFGLALSLGVCEFGGTALVNAKENEKEKTKEKAKEKEKKGNDTKKEDAKKEAEKEKTDANDLSMELDVLSALRRLNPTPEQLKQLQALAKDAGQPHRKRKPAKVTDKIHHVMVKLVDAYVHNDDAKIDSLEEELEKLKDANPAEFDDVVEVTDAARGKAPDLMRQFTAPQVHIFMIQMEVQDPFEQLMLAIDDAQVTASDEWPELRDSHAGHIAWSIVGADATKATKTRAQITSLLNMAHEIKPDEFKKAMADLEKTAHKIVGGVDPLAVLRNTFEYHLATLLSNPKLIAAVEAKRKKE